MPSKDKESLSKRTQFAFICTRLMCSPCWCLLSLLVFILYKNVHLNPFQIGIIVALKPTSSLLSPYWSQAIFQRPDRIISNLIGANFFRHLPFLLIPWIHTPWFTIFSFGLYMTLTRATIPAWMELFKYNLPQNKREQMVGYGTIIDYLGSALLAVGAGILLDHYQEIWRWLFFICAIFGVLSTLILTSLSLNTSLSISRVHTPSQNFKIKEKIVRPWKLIWQVICQNRDFSIFQIGFMLGGGGLMIMQPAFPQFFIDTLNLSFVEMGLAISLCKGVGVALTSSLWTRVFRKINIFSLSFFVTFFAALFPFLLLATSFHIILFYLAYAIYGVMQAGSELSWHMSGLVFAKENDSSPFSVTNVLTVGIRGCVIPALGSVFLSIIHPVGVILLGAFICFSASVYFLFTSRSIKNRLITSEKKSI